MIIRLLGTGYGECQLKKKNSKDYRGRGGVILDENILIDAPDDIFQVAEDLGFSDVFKKISDVIITHSHKGHFSPRAINRLAMKKKINVFATKTVLDMLPENENITKIEIKPLDKFKVSTIDVIALPTNHKTENITEKCLNLLLMKDRTLFYGLDGAFINGTAYNILSQITIDAALIEIALSDKAPSSSLLMHNDITAAARIKAMLDDDGISHEKTRFILTHIPTDKKRDLHEELSQEVSKLGMTLAYDGYYARI